MRLESWDSVFVRARRADVHPVLRDVAGYGRWWPGLSVRPSRDGLLLIHDPPGMPRARHAVTVSVRKDRPDLGLDLCCSGDLVGEAEWYYLDEVDGTTVHHLLRAETADRGWRRRLAAHRASVRAALHALKDGLEGARVVGSEPDPTLLADQVEALAAFRAGVEAHARKVAEGRAPRMPSTARATRKGLHMAGDTVRESIVVKARPDEVMDVIADFESYPEWQDEFKEVEILETDEDGWGTKVRFQVDAKVLTTELVLEYEYTPDAMRWWLVEGTQVRRNDGVYQLEDLGDGATRVEYELTVEPSIPLPGMIRRKAAQRIVHGALEGLKQRLEQG